MNLLCFSDLHLDFEVVTVESIVLSPLAKQVMTITEANNPDIVVVTGDIICPGNLDRIFFL